LDASHDLGDILSITVGSGNGSGMSKPIPSRSVSPDIYESLPPCIIRIDRYGNATIEAVNKAKKSEKEEHILCKDNR